MMAPEKSELLRPRWYAAVGSGADEAGNDRDDAGFEGAEGELRGRALGLLEMLLRVAESVASEDELRGVTGTAGTPDLSSARRRAWR